MKTCVLLSGGIDSIALSYLLRPALAVTIDYGQHAAKAELSAATEVCEQLSIEHKIVHIDCTSIGYGCMRQGRSEGAVSFEPPSPEWWPYRNQLLITIAASLVVTLAVDCLAIGTVLTDRQHSDGSDEFIERMNALLACQEGHITLSAPARDITSMELVRKSRIPRSILAWAHSCHKGNHPCGICRGCTKHFSVLDQLLD